MATAQPHWLGGGPTTASCISVHPMDITVKLFAHFRDNRFKIESRPIAPGTTVGDIVDSLGIPRDEVGVLMINSRHTTFTVMPAPGDILAIFPMIGGG